MSASKGLHGVCVSVSECECATIGLSTEIYGSGHCVVPADSKLTCMSDVWPLGVD